MKLDNQSKPKAPPPEVVIVRSDESLAGSILRDTCTALIFFVLALAAGGQGMWLLVYMSLGVLVFMLKAILSSATRSSDRMGPKDAVEYIQKKYPENFKKGD